MQRFVVAGCGRAGTLYTSRLLTKLGVRTSHEEYFTCFTQPSAVPMFDWWCDQSETVGESSSLTPPYLSLLPKSTLVFHQVRNPIQAIRSLMGLNTFENSMKMRMLHNLRYFFRHMPQADHDDPPIVLAMKYWVFWNRSVGKNAVREPIQYRVEDMSNLDTGRLAGILQSIGHDVSPERLKTWVDKFGTKFHTFKRDETITLSKLPDIELKQTLIEDALMYGYSLDEIKDA